MTTRTRKRSKQPSSCPDGYVPAGHVVPIRLTVRQQQYCRRAVGVRRFVYNLCVATHQFCRTNRLKWPSWQDLNKEFNAIKHEQFPFVTEVSKHVAEGAIRDFGDAVANWRNPSIRGRKPTFKKRRLTGTGSFKAAHGMKNIRYDGKRRIKLPHLGSVKLDHTLPEGIFYEARISFRNGQWMLSLNYWKPPQEQPAQDERIQKGAVDTGINPHATDSEAQTWENPKAYYQAEKKLARWQRAQARRVRNSRGWWEAQRHIDQLYRRIKNLRHQATHQMTSELVHKYQYLAIENPYVAGLMKGKTPKAQADASMGEIKRQLIYKGQWQHCQIVIADRFYPSSKSCSKCRFVHAKLKRERFWQCPNCTIIHERNINAAINLRSLLDETLVLPVLNGEHAPRREGSGPLEYPAGETGPNDRRTATLSTRAPQTVIG